MAEVEIVTVEARTPKRKKPRTWKDEEIKHLIDKYEERPCLWDTFHKEYHDKTKKLVALSEIEESMGITREEIQAKWNMLRGQYSREVHLVSKTKSGASVDDRYVSKWQYFQQLQFLQVVVEARKSTDTLSTPSTNVDEDDASEAVHEGGKRPRKKKENADVQNLLLERALEVLQEPPKSVDHAESEGEQFGAYVGMKLNGFNPRQRAIATKRISDVLFEIEMGNSFGQLHPASVSQYPDLRGIQREPVDSYLAMLGYSNPTQGSN